MMNRDQIKREVDALREELHDMRDSARAVHGTEFADLVLAIFELLTMQELVGRLARHAPPELGAQYISTAAEVLGSLGKTIAHGWSKEAVEEATKHADKMAEKQHALQERIELMNGGGE